MQWYLMGRLLWSLASGCSPRVQYVEVDQPGAAVTQPPSSIPVYFPGALSETAYRVIRRLYVGEVLDLLNLWRLSDSDIIRRLREKARRHGTQAIIIGKVEAAANPPPSLGTDSRPQWMSHKPAVARKMCLTPL